MGSLQLFTAALLAVCAAHLLFSAVAVVSRWLAKNRPATTARRDFSKISKSGWYVFFDPADLYGKTVQPKTATPSRENRTTNNSRKGRKANDRRMTARPSA